MSNYQNALGKIGAFLDGLVSEDHVPREIAVRLDEKLQEVVRIVDALAAATPGAKKVSDLTPYIETLKAAVKDLRRDYAQTRPGA